MSIDNTQKFQVMRGFGAASAWNSSASLSALAPTLWDDDSAAPVSATASHVDAHIGLSMLRTRIDPTGNFASEAGPMTLAKGRNPNILIWSTEWSPPAALKNNNNVNGPAANNTFNSTAANETAYATYLVNYLKTIKNTYGVNLYAVSPQNEPDYNTSYESCLWTAAQFDDFTKNYLAPAITAAGLSTKIMITESFKDDLNLAATTMNDAAAAPLISIIGTHIYGGGPTALSSGGWSHLTTQEGWQTEMSDVSGQPNDFSMTSGLQIAGWIQSCIVNAGFNAYHHWWIRTASAENSGLCDVNGNVTKKLFVLGNYSKFIRPGFQRIGATAAPATGLNCSAYSTAGRVVIVAINKNTGTSDLNFSLNGLNVGSVVPWVTDGSDNLAQKAAVAVSGNSFTYTMPGQSVVTFVGDIIGSAPTATASSTRTVTPPPSKTATSSPTPSSTKTTVPATASSTVTPSFSFTRTVTPIPTGTSTQTVTAVSTGTQTRTVTPVPTGTETRTPTAVSTGTETRTSTAVSTGTETRTSTAISTGTETRTSTAVSTGTATPSTTPSSSESPSPQPSATFTETAAAPTSSITPSSSPSETARPSATDTPSVTPPSTFSSTSTPSPASTLTSTSTITPSDTQTVTLTVTLSATPSLTSVPPSATSTWSPTRTATSTNTWTSTPVPPSATFTPTRTKTATPLPTWTATEPHTPVPTKAPEGPLKVEGVVAVPNPNPIHIAIDLSGSADEVVVKVWSVSFHLVAESTERNVRAGWSSVALPAEFLRTAPNGAYYVSVSAERRGSWTAGAPARFLILR